MDVLLDVSKVDTGVFQPCSGFEFINQGLWHNFYTLLTLQQFQEFGTNDPTLDQITQKMDLLAAELEASKILPVGGVQVVQEIIKVVNDGQSTSTFGPTIDALMKINLTTINSPDFRNTSILGVTGTSYYSALFWSQVIDTKTHKNFGIPKWLKILAHDILGGLSGLKGGAIVGGLVGNPILGAVLGGIIGGVAESLA